VVEIDKDKKAVIPQKIMEAIAGKSLEAKSEKSFVEKLGLEKTSPEKSFVEMVSAAAGDKDREGRQ